MVPILDAARVGSVYRDERCPVSEVQSPRQKKGHPWHRGIPSMELDIGPAEKSTYSM